MLTPTDDSHRPLTCTELVAHSLRLHPGQSIVGEVHDAGTAAMLDVWNVRLQGGTTTIHPDEPKQL